MAGRGKKDCSNCKEEVGARLVLCECGYHFLEKKIRSDLLEAKNAPKDPRVVKTYDSVKQGRKSCLTCGTIVGSIAKICPKCNFDYILAKKEKKEAQKIKREKDLEEKEAKRKERLEKKEERSKQQVLVPKEVKTYDSLGRGKKGCPTCETIVAGVTKICPKCDFDYVSAKKEKDIIKEEKKVKKQEKRENNQEKEMSPITNALMAMPKYEAPHDYTPKEHATRILSFGKQRAENLLQQHKTQGGWGHVDWKFLETELVK